MSNVIVKKFDELDIHDLYKIMETRVAVFVVEQKCPYPEIDGQDEDAMHLYIKKDDSILAYLRILNKGDKFVSTNITKLMPKMPVKIAQPSEMTGHSLLK